MAKKKQNKKIESPATTSEAKFPEKVQCIQESKGVFPEESPASIFDPTFPEKKSPTEQWLIDRVLIYRKINDLPTFVKALKDKNILNYWIKCNRFYPVQTTQITFEIHQRGEQLRQAYIQEHNIDIKLMPNNLFEMDAWRFDVERILKTTTQKCEHSTNFDWINWYGQEYTFNNTQAKIIKLLWEAQEPVNEKTIAQHINTVSDKYRLIDSFRIHGKYDPAWNTVIKRLGRGTYTLNRPNKT